MIKSFILLILLVLFTAFTWGQPEINYPGSSEIMINNFTATRLLHPVQHLAPMQGGEDIDNAYILSGPLPITSEGTTEGYLDDYNEICPYDTYSYAPDVVYQYTPPANVTVDIDLCGSSYDTKVFVYENSYTPGAPFACNDDYYYGPACGDYVSKIAGAQLTGGNTYYIVIDGYNDSGYGDYVLTISRITAALLPMCESFPSSGWPSGWSEQLQGLITSSHWSLTSSNYAGGSIYEAIASWEPGEGETQADNDRLISPPLNTTGLTSVHLSFHQMLNDYDADVNDVWLRVQSSSDAVNWTDEWVYAGGLGNPIPAEVKELDITNNLGDITWIAWTLSGYTYDINFWYVDDVCIALPCATNTWTGNVSTDWNDPENWTCGVFPDQEMIVIIPSVPSGGNFPVIADGIIAECYDITVELPGTLTIQDGGFLNVKNP